MQFSRYGRGAGPGSSPPPPVRAERFDEGWSRLKVALETEPLPQDSTACLGLVTARISFLLQAAVLDDPHDAETNWSMFHP